MAGHDRSARAGSDRTSLCDDITQKIIAELEQGRAPWVQPWGTSAAKAPLGLPKNAATSRSYSGINILILRDAVVQYGFPGQGWLTFRQALSLGGSVMKGERGTTVVHADRFTPEDEKRRTRETGEEAHAIPFLKRFTAFNTAQCESLPEDVTVAPEDFGALPLPDSPAATFSRSAADGLHVIMADDHGDHRIWFPRGEQPADTAFQSRQCGFPMQLSDARKAFF